MQATNSLIKSIFHSKTFWGAALTVIVSLSPVIAQKVADYQNTV
jgi:hypothetical protein